MNAECGPFRAELELALTGSRAAFERLGDHEHIHACAPCRAEHERERRLERLLERLPGPDVPARLSSRLMASLKRARSEVESSLAGSGDLASAELDELLSRLPAPRVPADLAGRVLAGTVEARTSRALGAAFRWRHLLVAAALLVALGVVLWRSRSSGEVEPVHTTANLEADEELLIYAVERWELLHDDDLDVWLASLDSLDELLMEVSDDEDWLDQPMDAHPSRPDESAEGG